MSTRKKGTYLRFKISPSTIRSGARLGGQVLETGLGVNRIVSGIRLKKSIERHARLDSGLQMGKAVAEIGTGIATAFTSLFSRR
jgi:hypothetical protein